MMVSFLILMLLNTWYLWAVVSFAISAATLMETLAKLTILAKKRMMRIGTDDDDDDAIEVRWKL